MSTEVRVDPLEVAARVKGFLPEDEAAALREAARAAGPGLWLEIGTYCGKSTLHLGSVAREVGAKLYTVDHHHGSEENQPGWEWHDTELVDPQTGRLDTLPSLRHALNEAQLEDVVTVIVGTTAQAAELWGKPVRFLFLDGNHTEEIAQHDYLAFAQHVEPGGTLAIHDVFPNPEDGGRPPYNVFCRAVETGVFTPISEQGSLRILQRNSVPIY
jgi:predicted O-methyltransferase YrrM